MANQRISQSALLKAILVFISVGALIMGIRLFHHLPEFLGMHGPDHTPSRAFSHNSLKEHGDVNDVYIPVKESPKRAPIHFDTHVK